MFSFQVLIADVRNTTLPFRAEHTQRLLRHRSISCGDVLTICVGDRAHSALGVDVCTKAEQLVRRAIDERAQAAIGHDAHDGAAFPVGIERNLVMLWE